MEISLVVAVAANGVIGQGDRLPWHLPADLRHFRALTLGKPIVMGRRTHFSLGRPLPERRNIVLTRDKGFHALGCEVVHSVGEALAAVADAREVMVIGGADVYRQFLPLASRIHVTEVHAEFSGDTRFPDLRREDWVEVAREEHSADDRNPFRFDFVTLERPAR